VNAAAAQKDNSKNNIKSSFAIKLKKTMKVIYVEAVDGEITPQ
jgi:hypothetical protein